MLFTSIALGCLWKSALEKFFYMHWRNHGQINYKDTKSKWRHLKILTCKGTLRQVFVRVYRLEIQTVMLVFSTQLCVLLPLYPSLCSTLPPPPLPCVNMYTVYTYTVWKGGGIWGSGPQTDKYLLQSPYDDILHCLLWALSVYGRNSVCIHLKTPRAFMMCSGWGGGGRGVLACVHSCAFMGLPFNILATLRSTTLSERHERDHANFLVWHAFSWQ